MNKNLCFEVTPGAHLQGEIDIPGDKSISHRALILGALAEGTTKINYFLKAEDTLATLHAFRNMGIEIDHQQDQILVKGKGLTGLLQPDVEIDCGNSGTSMRLLTGILAGQLFDTVLTGDASLLKRPMGRIVNPLMEMGAEIEMQVDEKPPLLIHGHKVLKGIHYKMPIASAQVKSCLLLAGMYAKGETTLISPAITRDHTERMLINFGYPIHLAGPKITLTGQQTLYGTTIDVPGDISSAAFFMIAAMITPQSELFIRRVGLNPSRIGVINILRMMGGKVTIENETHCAGEPIGDIRVRTSKLFGIDIPRDQVPLAIDEFPILFIAAATAQGVTRLRGAEELHYKESDRILVMAEGLKNLGINVEVNPDGLTIEGGQFQGGLLDSQHDHRVAMAFAIAGLVAKDKVKIKNCDKVATSFPNFIEVANQVGIKIAAQSNHTG